jgi:pimeloyl-ACP methyl ester carboxylesterase
VHGFRATGQWWDHIAPHFADRFRVVAIDLSGMGDSGTRGTYSRALHGVEILEVIKALGLRQTTIAAHSYGTFASLCAARIDPDPINRMILIDGYPSPAGPIPETPQNYYRSKEEISARYRLIPPGGLARSSHHAAARRKLYSRNIEGMDVEISR